MSSVQIGQKSYEMPPREGISIAHFLTVADIERSARYYEKVFGARVLSLGDGNAPGYLQLANIWMNKTQPEIANRTRVCAFDRASYGFSDPASKPEIMADVVSDLHAALQAADVPGPYVLVGHSSGGFEARVFAQKWPGEVAGMVLLDTSYAGQVLDQTNMPSFKGLGFEGEGPAALKCALLAAHGPLDPSNP